MKKVLFALGLITTLFCACDNDKNNDATTDKSNNKIVGEWKAKKIDATMQDGSKWITEDPNELRYQLDGLEWINITEHHFQTMNDPHNFGEQILRPYYISNKKIVFTGAEINAEYYLHSVNSKEMVIKYVGAWTSYIYYTRVK